MIEGHGSQEGEEGVNPEEEGVLLVQKKRGEEDRKEEENEERALVNSGHIDQGTDQKDVDDELKLDQEVSADLGALL